MDASGERARWRRLLMSAINPKASHRWIALFVGLASVYLLAYSGVSESRDSNRLFDAVGSLVEWGDFRLDLATWENPPTAQVAEWFPLESAAVEPATRESVAGRSANGGSVNGGSETGVWETAGSGTAAAACTVGKCITH